MRRRTGLPGPSAWWARSAGRLVRLVRPAGCLPWNRRPAVPQGGGVRGDRGPDSGPDTGPARCRGRGCGAAGRGVRSRTCPGACQRLRAGSTPVRSHRTHLSRAPASTPYTPYDLPFPPHSTPRTTPPPRPKTVAGFHAPAMRTPRVRRIRPGTRRRGRASPARRASGGGAVPGGRPRLRVRTRWCGPGSPAARRPGGLARRAGPHPTRRAPRRGTGIIGGRTPPPRRPSDAYGR